MITAISIHNLQHAMATEPIQVLDRGGSFWSTTLAFVNERGEIQRIILHGPSQLSVTLQKYDRRLEHSQPVNGDDTAELAIPEAAGVTT